MRETRVIAIEDIDNQLAKWQQEAAERDALIAALEARVSELSVDSLTGLPTRRFGEAQLAQDFERRKRGGYAHSVLMLDVDHFKRINDDHGHAFRDWALKMVSGVLHAACRSGDYLCRWGGEEFLISSLHPAEIQNGLNRHNDPCAFAERIRKLIELHTPVTVSIGYVRCDGHFCSVEEVVKFADSAMYKAKRHGRNRVRSWVD